MISVCLETCLFKDLQCVEKSRTSHHPESPALNHQIPCILRPRYGRTIPGDGSVRELEMAVTTEWATFGELPFAVSHRRGRGQR